MNNIWQSLPSPFFVLAPMDDVTDTVFRQIVGLCGRPDVFFTEFTSVEGLMSRGREKVMRRLQFETHEKPIIAQIWGLNPEKFYESAKLISKMNFDGIDINMGCPQKDVVARGACSAMIKNPELAKEIIDAARKGAGNLPISVKTRLGYDKIQMEWIEFLLKQKLDALTIHLRTVREMSKVEAHWNVMETVQTLKHKISPETRIIGNGDVNSYTDGAEKCKKYGCDGVMIGRGALANPWIFNPKIDFEKISQKEKFNLLIKHLELFEKTWGNSKDWNALKKFYKVYVSGFPKASEIRLEMMRLQSSKETFEYIKNFFSLP